MTIQTLRSSFLASRDAAATAPAAAFSLRLGGDTAAKSKAEAVGGDSACCFSSSAIEITIPANHRPGAKLMCRLPNGTSHTVLVPAHAGPGSKVRFRVPSGR